MIVCVAYVAEVYDTRTMIKILLGACLNDMVLIISMIDSCTVYRNSPSLS